MSKFRFFSLVLSVIVLLTLCACGQNTTTSVAPTATDIYSSAQKKMSEALSFTNDMTVKYQLINSGTESNLKIDATTKYDANDPDNIKMSMDMTMPIAELGEMAVKATFCDSYMYMEMLGQKVKAKTDISTANSIFSSYGGNYSTTSEEALIGATASTEGDKTIITASYSAEALNKLLKSYFESISADMATAQFTASSAVVTIDANGYIEKISMVIGANVTAGGQDVQMKIWMDISYSNINEKVEISAPADAASYTTVDASALQNTTVA